MTAQVAEQGLSPRGAQEAQISVRGRLSPAAFLGTKYVIIGIIDCHSLTTLLLEAVVLYR